jgi:uncharacterized repeat protein (TIGR03843 family)
VSADGADRAGPPDDPAEILEALAHGSMEVHGRIPGSSNATLLVTCSTPGVEMLAVYKPERGERPLWDFPRGIWRREVAAYELSHLLAWDLVPETVGRADGPFGEGSVQRFVDEDGTSHYFTVRDEESFHPVLVRLAAFDVLANNADRKSGHVLLADGRLYAIDNALCFHDDDKLRTVIWDFASERLDDGDCAAVARVADEPLPAHLAELLDEDEVTALRRRARSLARSGALPTPREDGDWPPYPWPLV